MCSPVPGSRRCSVRVVSARAARRVTALPLAEGAWCTTGAPFGRRWYQQLARASPQGGVLASPPVRRCAVRVAPRAWSHRIHGRVGAAFLVPSLATTVNEYDEAAFAPWRWETSATARRRPAVRRERRRGARHDTAVFVYGRSTIAIDAWGLPATSSMFSAPLRSGRWFAPGSRELVMSAGLAEDGAGTTWATDVELASGTVAYTLTGTVDDHWIGVYADRDVLAADLGAPGRANVVLALRARRCPTCRSPSTWRRRPTCRPSPAPGTDHDRRDLRCDRCDRRRRGGLAVLSSMLVSLFERRHELAAMRALGARVDGCACCSSVSCCRSACSAPASVSCSVRSELRGIIASFEASNSVDIGVVDATGAEIPLVVWRRSPRSGSSRSSWCATGPRRPIAVTLRGAA